MRVLEFQAKRLLQERGIPIPKGVLVRSAGDLAGLDYPAVLKAQVPVGGRGKAGGIRVVGDVAEASRSLGELLALSVRGHPVRVVLAEEQLAAVREFYVAVAIDRTRNAPILLASAAGGVEIEETAKQDPTRVARRGVDLCLGPTEHDVCSLAMELGLGAHVTQFRAIVGSVFALFRDCDATLVEINPLALCERGLVALDAKVLLDDKASFRHPELFGALRDEQRQVAPGQLAEAERLAEAANLTYVALHGDIALISDGAGTGMLTLDLIQDAGGHAASFCELGALANAEGMQVALRVALADPQTRVVLVSLIGGLTRMDDIAEGIATFLRAGQGVAPIVVRMAGTKEEEGRAILHALGIAAFDDLAATVREAVSLTKEGPCLSS
jgi:succinyl-CoA synthetase beta subunit